MGYKCLICGNDDEFLEYYDLVEIWIKQKPEFEIVSYETEGEIVKVRCMKCGHEAEGIGDGIVFE